MYVEKFPSNTEMPLMWRPLPHTFPYIVANDFFLFRPKKKSVKEISTKYFLFFLLLIELFMRL